MLENTETLSECCAAVTNKWCEGLDRLDIVCINIESGLGDNGYMWKGSREVTCQSLYEDLRGSVIENPKFST